MNNAPILPMWKIVSVIGAYGNSPCQREKPVFVTRAEYVFTAIPFYGLCSIIVPWTYGTDIE